jgi:hypothetical protein
VAYPFQLGPQLIAASQSVDSRNRLAAILLIAGISYLMQLNELVTVDQFPLSAINGKPIAATNHEPVTNRTCEKIITHEMKGLSTVNSMQRAPVGYG